MINTEMFDVWNLTKGGIARCGCVDIFNVVGRIRDPDAVETFTYRLNGGFETPVFFLRSGSRQGRLTRPGEFNIDTIGLADLEPENTLRLRVVKNGGKQQTEEIPFRTQPFEQLEPRFRLELDGAGAAEEVGQVVEGPWRVARDQFGRPCLEVSPEDAGYDRIILFGHQGWTTGYEVRARLAVTRILGRHNVGIAFKWNPHERGDGTHLPKSWSSGLGYYSSYGKQPGLRIRYGVKVQYDQGGHKRGSFVLAQAPLHTRWGMRLTRLKQAARLAPAASDLKLNQEYVFRMRVHPRRYRLAVWPAEQPEPSTELKVDEPHERLPQGAVGILAYQVGIRLYEYEVTPLSDSPA